MITELLNYYSSLTKDCPVRSINTKFSYYMADDLDVNVKCVAPLVYYDIESAFPSILKLLLEGNDEYQWYLDGIDELTGDKIKRLVFISTNAPKIKPNLLQELNSMAKIVVFSMVYNLYDNVQILEYKKDSLLVKADPRANPKIRRVHAILNKYFKFHVDLDLRQYYRFERTSIYVDGQNNVDIKGILKNMPPFIINSVIPALPNIVDNPKLQQTIRNIYSPEYYLTLKKFGKFKDIADYYAFGNRYMTNYKNTLVYEQTPECTTAVLLKIIYLRYL